MVVGWTAPASANEEGALSLLVIPDLQTGIRDVLGEKIDAEWHAGRYEKIFPLFYLLTRLDPHDAESYALGGWFLINGILPKVEKQSEKDRITAYALRFWEEGLARNNNEYTIYWELGWYWYRRDDFRRALGYLDSAERYPHPANVSVTKAHVYLKLGMNAEALVQWKKVWEKFPDRRDVAERFINQLTNKTNE